MLLGPSAPPVTSISVQGSCCTSQELPGACLTGPWIRLLLGVLSLLWAGSVPLGTSDVPLLFLGLMVFHWYHRIFLWALPLIHWGPPCAKDVWWSVARWRASTFLFGTLCCVCPSTCMCNLSCVYHEVLQPFEWNSLVTCTLPPADPTKSWYALPVTRCSPCLAPSPPRMSFLPSNSVLFHWGFSAQCK